IRASVADVEFELVLAVALVVMVIFLFLRSVSATIIPSVAVPLSLVGTFGVMYLAGFSINNLTLMALTIATGFVVDDAIVMIENISRYIEAGEPPLQAALKGAEQIGFTIISLTFSLIAVLIPLPFLRDGVVRRDGRTAAGAGGRHPRRSGCREPVVVHRRRRHQCDAQQRPDADQSEAARKARCERGRGHPKTAAFARRRRRHHAVHAAGAGP